MYEAVFSDRDFYGRGLTPSQCSWGWNGDGQLGLGDHNNRISPELVDVGSQDMLSVSKVLAILIITLNRRKQQMSPYAEPLS